VGTDVGSTGLALVAVAPESAAVEEGSVGVLVEQAAREAASAAAPTAATRRLFIFGDVSSVVILCVETRGYHYVAVRMPARTSSLMLGVLIALLVPHLASRIPCSDRFR